MKINIENATPLPWGVSQGENNKFGRTIDLSKTEPQSGIACGIWIATVHTNQTSYETAEANANLIIESANQHAALVRCENILRRICTLSKLNLPPRVLINEFELGDAALTALEAIRKEGK